MTEGNVAFEKDVDNEILTTVEKLFLKYSGPCRRCGGNKFKLRDLSMLVNLACEDCNWPMSHFIGPPEFIAEVRRDQEDHK